MPKTKPLPGLRVPPPGAPAATVTEEPVPERPAKTQAPVETAQEEALGKSQTRPAPERPKPTLQTPKSDGQTLAEALQSAADPVVGADDYDFRAFDPEKGLSRFSNIRSSVTTSPHQEDMAREWMIRLHHEKGIVFNWDTPEHSSVLVSYGIYGYVDRFDPRFASVPSDQWNCSIDELSVARGMAMGGGSGVDRHSRNKRYVVRRGAGMNVLTFTSQEIALAHREMRFRTFRNQAGSHQVQRPDYDIADYPNPEVMPGPVRERLAIPDPETGQVHHENLSRAWTEGGIDPSRGRTGEEQLTPREPITNYEDTI